MRFLDLEPVFLKITDERHFHHGDDVTIENCDGVQFLCPTCFKNNSGPVGTHSIICWKPHVPQTFSPTPGRWGMRGTGLGDLTLFGSNSSSSVYLTGPGCGSHFHVTDGNVTSCTAGEVL